MFYKTNLIKDLFWTPFDVRFSGIIERLKKHKKLLEMELEAAKITEFRTFVKLWEAEIQAAREDQELRRNDIERVKAQAMSKLLHHVREMLGSLNISIGRTILELKKWINAPIWTDIFETAERRWIEGTGSWFFDEPTYLTWLHHTRQASRENQTHQILFVKGSFHRFLNIISAPYTSIGKPGFGKTILAMQVVKNLQNSRVLNHPTTAISSQRISNHSVVQPTVAYFFFQKQMSDSQRSSAALRALLAQLLHTHQQTEIFIDAAVLMMGREGSGQLHASENEVQSILRFVLQNLTDTYIVLDGLDECGDLEELLEYLFDVAGASSCKFALIGRPDIPADKKYTNALHLPLGNSQNIADIQKYLRPQVEDLVATGAFSGTISAATIVSKISSRSGSMFLWVVLLISFLRSPVLTPIDRTTSVLNLNLLEGLDELYTRIFRNLIIRYPDRNQRFKITKLLNWVCISSAPIDIDLLNSMLAIRVGQTTSKANLISNFKNTLQEMSGALVEVTQYRTVRFIHLSVREFLFELEDQHPELFRTFRISASEAHLSLASAYLSYLTHDVPRGPLSGSADTAPSAQRIHFTLPLLPHACNWPSHASNGIENYRGTMAGQIEINLILEFCSAIEAFMTCKSTTSGWIEASWLFGTPPLLSTFLLAVDRLILKDFSISENHRQRLKDLKALVSRFASQLSELETLWGHILAVQPNEIWEPSIYAFTQSEFLVGGEHMKVASLDSKFDASAISIASQVSADSLDVGFIKVIPPK